MVDVHEQEGEVGACPSGTDDGLAQPVDHQKATGKIGQHVVCGDVLEGYFGLADLVDLASNADQTDDIARIVVERQFGR